MDSTRPPEEIRAHYEDAVDEDVRIRRGLAELELVRTKEILRRHLPDRALTILDVGGSTGVHAEWLLQDGHRVHLVEPIRSHVGRSMKNLARWERFSAEEGDARDLRRRDGSCDVVLLLGPLYHLTDRLDRLLAWREARRVVKPGGLAFGAAITRFASPSTASPGNTSSTLSSARSLLGISRPADTGTLAAGRGGSRPRTSTTPMSSTPRPARQGARGEKPWSVSKGWLRGWAISKRNGLIPTAGTSSSKAPGLWSPSRS
ncbi:MAG: methyltransferase domain-containing protein [Acidimicrobiia bacterium]